VACAAADIRGGDVRSGCAMWTDEIIDLRYVDHGQDLYLRLAKSELPPPPSAPRAFPTAPVVGASAAAVVLVIVLVLVLTVIRRRRGPTISGNKLTATMAVSSFLAISSHRFNFYVYNCIYMLIPTARYAASTSLGQRNFKKMDVPGARSCALSFPCIEHQHSPAHSVTSSSAPAPAPIVPCVDLLTLREATGYFSESNIIGRGGFGVVYEVCVLPLFLLFLGSAINLS